MEDAPRVFAVKHKNECIRLESRSGGVFTALSNQIFKADGVVYGCVLNDNIEAIHIRATSPDKRDKMRGSKYVQSRLGETYRDIKQDLNQGKYVLFSGTSCQVAGLKAYLKKEHENLLCIDILCHGVPSPYLLKKYLEWQQKKHQYKIQSIDFRNKKDYGWSDHVESLFIENGNRIDSRIYRNLFYSLNGMRPSCYECQFKSINHPGDITLADYWGIDKAVPGFSDNKGVSLVFINSEKGYHLFKSSKNELDWIETKIEECMMQKCLVEPYLEPSSRCEFWKDLNSKPFQYIAKKYGGFGLLSTVKGTIGKIIWG